MQLIKTLLILLCLQSSFVYGEEFSCPLSSKEPESSPLYISPDFEDVEYPIFVTDFEFSPQTGVKKLNKNFVKQLINCSLSHMFYFASIKFNFVNKPFGFTIPSYLSPTGRDIVIAPENNKSLIDYSKEVTWFYDQRKEIEKSLAFSGFSAEDDPFHNKTILDKKFYNHQLSHDHRDQGTIRVALLPKAIQALHLAYTVGVEEYKSNHNSLALEAIQKYFPAIGFHEYMHAAQYHLKPVHDLNYNYGKQCTEGLTGVHCNCFEGLCDQALLIDQNIKVFYEEMANRLTVDILSPHYDVLSKGGEWILKYEELNPERFKAGEDFYLIRKESHFVDYYLKSLAAHADNILTDDGRFKKDKNNNHYIVYVSQARPPQLVWDLFHINNELFNHSLNKTEATARVKKIEEDWSYFVNLKKPEELKYQKFPWAFLEPVNKRYWVELQKAKNSLNLE